MPLLPQSARLTFRAWTAEDGELAWQLWGDPEVVKYIGGPFDRAQCEERLARHLEFAQRAGVQYWPLFTRDSSEFVGCCGLRPPRDGVYEHGFHLRRKFWGQGYGYEAARAVLKHAFEVLDAPGVWAGHHPEHTVSRALLLKLGFKHTHMELFKFTDLWHPAYHLWREDYCEVSPLATR